MESILGEMLAPLAQYGRHMGPGYGGTGSWWHMFSGSWLVTLLLVVGVVAVIVYLVRSRSMDVPTPRESARDILDSRYARGEIDREEYQRMKDDLGR